MEDVLRSYSWRKSYGSGKKISVTEEFQNITFFLGFTSEDFMASFLTSSFGSRWRLCTRSIEGPISTSSIRGTIVPNFLKCIAQCMKHTYIKIKPKILVNQKRKRFLEAMKRRLLNPQLRNKDSCLPCIFLNTKFYPQNLCTLNAYNENPMHLSTKIRTIIINLKEGRL